MGSVSVKGLTKVMPYSLTRIRHHVQKKIPVALEVSMSKQRIHYNICTKDNFYGTKSENG